MYQEEQLEQRCGNSADLALPPGLEDNLLAGMHGPAAGRSQGLIFLISSSAKGRASVAVDAMEGVIGAQHVWKKSVLDYVPVSLYLLEMLLLLLLLFLILLFLLLQLHLFSLVLLLLVFLFVLVLLLKKLK